jgi:hypothetical protein
VSTTSGSWDVFVSYAHEDRAKATALARALERRRLRVWWDPDLRAGDEWAQAIERAVEGAPCVVVLWSAKAVESRWVNAEARAGLDQDGLVPVRLDDVEPPLVFREIQWRDLVGWDGEGEPPGIDELAAEFVILNVEQLRDPPSRSCTSETRALRHGVSRPTARCALSVDILLSAA